MSRIEIERAKKHAVPAGGNPVEMASMCALIAIAEQLADLNDHLRAVNGGGNA